jgi:hypothetical protein
MPSQKLTSASQCAKQVETQTALLKRFVHIGHQRPQFRKISVLRMSIVNLCSFCNVGEVQQTGRDNSGDTGALHQFMIK